MTYRSDHDAALARVDVLEHEVARLAAENDSLKKSPSNTNTPLIVPALMAVAVAIIAGTFVLASTAGEPTQPPKTTEQTAILTKSEPLNPLEDCAMRLAAKPTLEELDAAGGAALIPGGVFRISCRDEVYTRLTRKVISPEERRALQWWLQAEDTFSRELAILKRHYDAEPLTRNDTGAAFYLKYAEAYDDRQAAITAWRRGPLTSAR